MSIGYILERPEHPAGELHPVWGGRFHALLTMQHLAPRLLQTGMDDKRLGDVLRRAFPGANVANTARLWHTDQSHHAFMLASNRGPYGNFGAISLLDITDQDSATVVAAHLAYDGGDSVSLLAGKELTITLDGVSTLHYPAVTAPAEPPYIETPDDRYDDATAKLLVEFINGPQSPRRVCNNPLYDAIGWLRTPQEVLLIRPGELDAAWFAPLLAMAAMIGATAFTLGPNGRLTPWTEAVAYPGQGLDRALFLVHAVNVDRFTHEAIRAFATV